jgi:hypothetical protein
MIIRLCPLNATAENYEEVCHILPRCEACSVAAAPLLRLCNMLAAQQQHRCWQHLKHHQQQQQQHSYTMCPPISLKVVKCIRYTYSKAAGRSPGHMLCIHSSTSARSSALLRCLAELHRFFAAA